MCTFTNFASVVACALNIVNVIIPILAGLALLMFLWGGVRYIYSAGEGHNSGREHLLWGLIALFVLFCIYGILRVLDNTFLDGTGLSGSNSSVPGVTAEQYQGQWFGPY